MVGAAGAGSYFLLLPSLSQNKAANTVSDALSGWKFPTTVKFPSTGSPGGPLAYSDIRDPGGIPQGLPVRLQIPVIGVDSAIEDALITPDGRMDVPAGTEDVAWFALGPHPGQVGSAVIGGHFGISNGVPFVFYKLDKLVVGDKVYILDDEGNTLAFIVRSTKSFDQNADATPVFTSTDGLAHLNLITCEGIWNQVNGSYPQRLVVFTDAIPSEGAAPASTGGTSLATGSPGTTITFSRSLGIGASGASVVTLQTFLEQRGLLELPPGVTNGFFGTLTSAAVAEYQTSVGLPGVGVLGPLTRAKLNAELASNATLPNTGTSLPKASTPLLQSLYATPLDGLVTSLFLILIALTVFAIIKRYR